MKLITKNFGEIDVDENKVITFKEGLPGFPRERHFVIIRDDVDDRLQEAGGENSGLFCWLQSTENGDLAFVLLNVFLLLDNYDPMIEEEELRAIGEGEDSDLLIYNIAVIPDNIENMRVNLRAPLVINTLTRLGKQFVLSNEGYAIQHYLFASQPDNPANTAATLER